MLESTSPEPDWTSTSPIACFAGWEHLVPYNLSPSTNLVKEVAEIVQKRRENAKVNIAVLGISVGIDQLFGIVRSWFLSEDWLSLFRSKVRILLAWDGRSINNPKDHEILENIEWNLFDTTKYDGVCELMTVITYGEGYYGIISLLRVSLVGNVVGNIEPIGCMKSVPKAILKNMQKKHEQIKLVHKAQRIRYIDSGGQGYPCFMSAVSVTEDNYGKKSFEPWSVGDGWRKALGVKHDPVSKSDEIVATVPQMMALLHLKGSCLRDLRSSVPLKFEPAVRSGTEAEIRRGVKIHDGPNGIGHVGKKSTVIVLFPRDSRREDSLGVGHSCYGNFQSGQNNLR